MAEQRTGADWEKAPAFSQQLTASVCAGHVLGRGGASPLSRQGRPKEQGSARASSRGEV
jgi:hypothetical protein